MEELFLSTLRLSTLTSILLLPVLIASPRLNRLYSASWKCRIWFFLCLCLLFPTGLLGNALAAVFPTLSGTVSAAVPYTLPISAADIPAALPQILSQPDSTAGGASAGSSPLSGGISLLRLAAILWISVAFVHLLRKLFGYISFKHTLLSSGKAPDSETASVFEEVKREVCIRENTGPRLLLSPEAPCPLLIGYSRSYVILPFSPYPKAELPLILRHELIHYKRRDLWLKLLLSLATVIHWFNPAVWLMARHADSDIEQACDDTVLIGCDFSHRTVYGEMLLSHFSGHGPHFDLTTGLKGRAKTMQARLHNIFTPKKGGSPVLTGLLSLLLVCAVALCTLTPAASAYHSSSALWTAVSVTVPDSGGIWYTCSAEQSALTAVPLSITETGQLCIYAAGTDKWQVIGDPVAAPEEWKSETEISSRQSARFLNANGRVYGGMVSETEGWLIYVIGNGVAKQDTYVYRTHDGGQTWLEATQLDAAWSPNYILFLDDAHAIISIAPFNGAPIFQTSDGGETWQPLQLPLPDGTWAATALSVEKGVISLTVEGHTYYRGEETSLVFSSKNYGKTWVQK